MFLQRSVSTKNPASASGKIWMRLQIVGSREGRRGEVLQIVVKALTENSKRGQMDSLKRRL